MSKRALICGISGQDGSYLAALLIAKGYQVVGGSRDVEASDFRNLRTLGIRERLELTSMTLTDFRSVVQVLERARPDEVYNLAGQSVALSFGQPIEAFESITVGTVNLIEAIRLTDRSVRLYNACSSECFGDTGEAAANEDAPFRPASPYATAKAAAYWAVANYRRAYGLWACSGILFNHESPLRPERFVMRKVVGAACRIARGSAERLKLGTLAIVRDWGWAPEYVEAMWQLLQQAEPRDYVVATGKPYSLEKLVQTAFAALDLDWRRHVDIDPQLARPCDPARVCGDASRIARELGWRARLTMPDIVRRLIEADDPSG